MSKCQYCHKTFTKINGKGGLGRHEAAHKADITKKKKKPSNKKSKTKAVPRISLPNKDYYQKNKVIYRKCKGAQKIRNKDGELVPCYKEHGITAFYSSGEIQASEGIMEEWLKKKFGNTSLIFNTGTAKKLFDIGVYHSNKPKQNVEFYEIKPRDIKSKDAQLLKKQQSDWAKKAMKMGISLKLVFYEENNFEFRHSKPIPLNMYNIKDYSLPYEGEKTEKNLKKIVQFTKLFNDKKLREISECYTGHSIKFMREIKKVREKQIMT